MDLLVAVETALALIVSGDPALMATVRRSLAISLAATGLAAAVALPLGAAMAVTRFPGRPTLVVLCNAAMGLPPVVVGLVVYLALSRAGPLGPFGLLFTPAAMVLAQAILVLPIVAALTRQALADRWPAYRDLVALDGVGRLGTLGMLLLAGRASLLTALLAGLGRAMAEVGAILIVGGNIDGVTRTMTTSIALETSRGDLPLALALGLIVLSITLALNLLIGQLGAPAGGSGGDRPAG